MTTPGIRLSSVSETVFKRRKACSTIRNVAIDPSPPKRTPRNTFFLPICLIIANESIATSLPSIRIALNARRNDPIITTSIPAS